MDSRKTWHLAAGLALLVALTMGPMGATFAGSGETTGEAGEMSLDEAFDNFKDDASKVGDKAEEVGSDIAEGAEEAYDSTKEEVEEATD